MAYRDQFAREQAARRGGECEGSDERPVRLEPLDCLPEQALGTGQGRETRKGESHVSRLRSTRTENLSRHSRGGGDPVDIDVASHPVGSEPSSVCAQPEEILNQVQDDEEAGDGGELGDGERGRGNDENGYRDDKQALPRPLPQVGGEKDASPAPTSPALPTRHDGWTPEIRVKFLNALANCGNVQSAVLFVQRSRTSAYALKRRDADFATAWDAALLLARDVATDVLQDRAINGVEEDVMYHGEVVATRRRYDSRLLLAHIARLDKLAEDLSTSRAAARFEDVTQAIAAKKDVTPLITEPTEAEKRERAQRLAVLGLPAEAVPDPQEPEAPFECTYKDDSPEIYMMTQGEADALAAEVAGLTIRAVDSADAVTAMTAAKDVPAEDLEADHARPEEKEHDPVHIVNFGEEEEEENEKEERN